MKIHTSINIFSKEYHQVFHEFKGLKDTSSGRIKQIAIVVLAALGALFTLPILGIGGIFVFYWSVKWMRTSGNSEAHVSGKTHCTDSNGLIDLYYEAAQMLSALDFNREEEWDDDDLFTPNSPLQRFKILLRNIPGDQNYLNNFERLPQFHEGIHQATLSQISTYLTYYFKPLVMVPVMEIPVHEIWEIEKRIKDWANNGNLSRLQNRLRDLYARER